MNYMETYLLTWNISHYTYHKDSDSVTFCCTDQNVGRKFYWQVFDHGMRLHFPTDVRIKKMRSGRVNPLRVDALEYFNRIHCSTPGLTVSFDSTDQIIFDSLLLFDSAPSPELLFAFYHQFVSSVDEHFTPLVLLSLENEPQ